MRTPAVVVVLLMGLGACGDTAAPHGANLQTLSGAQYGACGRGETQLRCWGSQGTLTGGNASIPVQPSAPINGLQLVRSSPFDEGGCGLNAAGALFCWGLNGSGYAAVAPSLRFTDVSMGGGFQCALEASATVYCWGAPHASGIAEDSPAIEECSNRYYNYACVPEPTPVATTQHFKAVASGWYHTCALSQSSEVFCWGSGAIGAGPEVQSSQTPVAVESSDRFSSLASAAEGTCAVNTAGTPLCWGWDNGGMLGSPDVGAYNYITEPTPVAFPAGVVIKSVILGNSHSCAIDTGSAAWCWGTGGLGSGANSSAAPVRVLGGLTFSTLAAGSGFTCGISGNGAWCWGSNSLGQLGNGGTTDSPIPVRVANQDQFND